MAKNITTVHAKEYRGLVRIIGMGKTPTGQSYRRATTVLKAHNLRDPRFKAEARTAVAEMLGESLSPE